ncbi:ATP-dependent helicase [Clostridioides difficile]|uniref:UvrD-helicase domain-containing protein n=5 Tax=Clostridioides difficile TaxID=1496 RepID=UPI0003B2A4B4|nr:ATP-dependent helicase [Clostridioides difficile]EIS9404716.1 ATP-dependent helicase [Clostridioides difficile]EKJ1252223.1 ATP-dependent helicase [Clostridioides difficile]EKS6764989.1 ATP-dependent helicase [Clostridioides difficile]MBF9865863.1 ATP-dependent helicase [Clostridioides difficile]MBH6852690.1 ATP-dependent helicase [Clostridioides difficile]
MKRNWIVKEEWHPASGFKLEVEAMNTVINDKNTLVVAGPGAGKTELLAQRACFLLETNTCKYPKKILAISFKKDAADNLKERVELRCGKELALRFESKTYDAFAKEIVDRFRNSLDEKYRPLNNYNIATNGDVRRAFEISGLNFRGNQTEFNKLYGNKLSINKLPLHTNFVDKIFIDAWNVLLKGKEDNNFESSLTFEMISRLAEYLIRTNRYIKKAIEMTYSHVFLDEFQDTTSIQYDLVKACFFKTETIITAVGDGKQRIMLWAGARKSIFEDFQNDFLSQKRTLIMNHRSAPRLVEIQKAMYNRFNEDAIDLKTNEKWNHEDGEAYLRLFEDYIKEADILSEEIVGLVESGIKINEICILVKQSVDIYSKEIIHKLSECNIKARNEAVYQELLKEDIIKILVSLFRLSLNDRSPDDWDYIYDILGELYGIDEGYNPKVLNDFITKVELMINDIKVNLNITDEKQFSDLVDSKVEYISYEKFASKFQQYKSKDYFDDLVDKFKKLVWSEYNETKDWIKAIDNFEGKNSIPIMTIHKSKGLEYDTIFFVGLEDSAFWNFKNQPDEDRCAFFVALSRAKRRIDFTFSLDRPAGFSNSQTHDCINEFYELFDDTKIVKRIEYCD